MAELRVGSKAPDFTLATGDGKEISLVKKKGAVVIGISTDSAASHANFAKKYELPFPLGSDEKKEAVKRYGVWKEKSMYMGTERTTFIIDERGTITHILPKVKVDGHVEEVLGLL